MTAPQNARQRPGRLERPGRSESTSEWVVRFFRDDLTILGRLRRCPGLTVCESEGVAWLRGTTIDEHLEPLLAALPAGHKFDVLPDGQLRAPGRCVPCGRLPTGEWTRLDVWLRPKLPAVLFPGCTDERVPLRLVRSPQVSEPTLLRTTLAAWVAYASRAPQVRLDRWAFAASATGEVLVRGAPLAPLPGVHWVERQGIAVPAGWVWEPAVEPAVIRELLELEPDDLVLWHPDGQYDRLACGDFVRATRSAVRLTQEASA